MKIEKLIILGVMTVFIISGLLLRNDKLAMFGLLALITYAFLTAFEFKKTGPNSKGLSSDEVKDLKGEIVKQNQLISEIQDRLARSELALGFKKNTENQV